MNFKELLDITRNLIDEIDVDEQVDVIIKSAINQAYQELGLMDSRVTSTVIPIINRLLTVPTDFVKIVTSTPSLEGSRKIGNSFLTDKTGTVTMVYEYSREMLVNDTDEIDLAQELLYPLALYGASKYFAYRKKVEVANHFIESYNNAKFDFEGRIYNTGLSESVSYYEGDGYGE